MIAKTWGVFAEQLPKAQADPTVRDLSSKNATTPFEALYMIPIYLTDILPVPIQMSSTELNP
jgi:hypothetical protein